MTRFDRSPARRPGRDGSPARRPGLAGLVVLAVVATGTVAGVAWELVVTPARLTRTAGGLSLDEVAGATVFAATGWFCVVTAVPAVVVGALLAPIARRAVTRTGSLAATVLSGVAPAVLGVVAWQVGELIGRGPSSAQAAAVPVGGAVDAALSLGTPVALLVGPLVALVVVLVVTVWPDRGAAGRDSPPVTPGD